MNVNDSMKNANSQNDDKLYTLIASLDASKAYKTSIYNTLKRNKFSYDDFPISEKELLWQRGIGTKAVELLKSVGLVL